MCRSISGRLPFDLNFGDALLGGEGTLDVATTHALLTDADSGGASRRHPDREALRGQPGHDGAASFIDAHYQKRKGPHSAGLIGLR
jgi:hypothetical protein